MHIKVCCVIPNREVSQQKSTHCMCGIMWSANVKLSGLTLWLTVMEAWQFSIWWASRQQCTFSEPALMYVQLTQRFDEVKSKVEKIALTDSVHSTTGRCQPDVTQWISEVLGCCTYTIDLATFFLECVLFCVLYKVLVLLYIPYSMQSIGYHLINHWIQW